jgi:hypothetical protein
MIYTSLAIVALSASTAVSPLSKLVHLHTHPATSDNRVSLTVYNKGFLFRDLKIDGRVYTVLSGQMLRIKAPSGTVIYAASRTREFKRGDVVLEVTPSVDHKSITIN